MKFLVSLQLFFFDYSLLGKFVIINISLLI